MNNKSYGAWAGPLARLTLTLRLASTKRRLAAAEEAVRVREGELLSWYRDVKYGSDGEQRIAVISATTLLWQIEILWSTVKRAHLKMNALQRRLAGLPRQVVA